MNDDPPNRCAQSDRARVEPLGPTHPSLGEPVAQADHRARAGGGHRSCHPFGTGNSSLAYLQRFPLDELKIDRSFIRGLGNERSATPLVAAIMGVARALRLSVVAEGIEEPAQLEELRALDCDAGQGYLFMRPQPPDVMASLLELDAVALSDVPAVGDTARS
jgi:sensor c-di-GMP phosphodiesterase-like protein